MVVVVVGVVLAGDGFLGMGLGGGGGTVLGLEVLCLWGGIFCGALVGLGVPRDGPEELSLRGISIRQIRKR